MGNGKHRRQLQPWLVGLVIAIVVFAVVLILFGLLGYGDDPVIEGFRSALS